MSLEDSLEARRRESLRALSERLLLSKAALVAQLTSEGASQDTIDLELLRLDEASADQVQELTLLLDADRIKTLLRAQERADSAEKAMDALEKEEFRLAGEQTGAADFAKLHMRFDQVQ